MPTAHPLARPGSEASGAASVTYWRCHTVSFHAKVQRARRCAHKNQSQADYTPCRSLCQVLKEKAQVMFVFYSVHYPKPEHEALFAEKMRQFDELMKKQPGITFVSDIFKDPEKGALIGFTFWESEEVFKAAWPVLVKQSPSASGEWEARPPEVYRFNAAG